MILSLKKTKTVARFIQHGIGMHHYLHAHAGGYQLILTCITWKNAVTNKIINAFLGPKHSKIQQNIIILAQQNSAKHKHLF